MRRPRRKRVLARGAAGADEIAHARQPPRRAAHRFVNDGARFSRNAAIPSF